MLAAVREVIHVTLQDSELTVYCIVAQSNLAAVLKDSLTLRHILRRNRVVFSHPHPRPFKQHFGNALRRWSALAQLLHVAAVDILLHMRFFRLLQSSLHQRRADYIHVKAVRTGQGKRNLLCFLPPIKAYILLIKKLPAQKVFCFGLRFVSLLQAVKSRAVYPAASLACLLQFNNRLGYSLLLQHRPRLLHLRKVRLPGPCWNIRHLHSASCCYR